jgi:restriction system protein
MKANKGIIVTSTFLTKGAIERVKRDNYELGKVEKPDLENWINRVLKGR